MSGQESMTAERTGTRRVDRLRTRPERRTELDYLEQEARQAKLEMKRSSQRIGRTLGSAAGDLWEKHPVAVALSAAGLACLGAALIARSRTTATRTITVEQEPARGESFLSRLGGFAAKTIVSLLVAKLTTPSVECATETPPDTEATE